jgi:hypothetical protein
MLGFRVGVTVSARVRVRVRFPPIKNRSTYVGSLKLCGISDSACGHNSPKAVTGRCIENIGSISIDHL